MKGANGMFEIIYIVVLMLASVPLIIILQLVIKNSEMEYLKDKTVIKVSNVIDYTVDPATGDYVMNYRGNCALNPAQTYIMFYVFDQYGLDTGRVYIPDNPDAITDTHEFDFLERSYQLNRDRTFKTWISDPYLVNLITEVSPGSNLLRKNYIYYDRNKQMWMLSGKNINIYE